MRIWTRFKTLRQAQGLRTLIRHIGWRVQDAIEEDGPQIAGIGVLIAILIGVVLFAWAGNTPTTNYSLNKPALNDSGWGTTWNNNLDSIDTLLKDNTLPVTVTSTTTPQLNLKYNGSNTAQFSVSSGGDLTITPSGGDTTLSGSTLTTGSTISSGGNILLNSNYLSGDGGNEGITVGATGTVTANNGFISNASVTLNGTDNVTLNSNYVSGDGDDEGVSVSSTGVASTSGNLSIGGNVLLNSGWLSGDGGNEGIQVSSTGAASTSGTLSMGGNIILNSTYLSGDGGNEGLQIAASGTADFSNNVAFGNNQGAPSNPISVNDTTNNNYSARIVNSSTGGTSDALYVQTQDTAAGGYVLRAYSNAGSNDIFSCKNNGDCYFPNHSTTASAANAFINSAGGNIQRSTSARKYKRDIQPVSNSVLSSILTLLPVTYKSNTELNKSDDPNEKFYGLIAEDVDKIFPDLVTKDPDGAPNYIEYDRLTVLLLKAIQEQQVEIRALEARVQKLEEK